MDNKERLNMGPHRAISWRSILGGIVTVIAFLLVLNLIGLAIGLGTINPTDESNPLEGLGTGSIIWWIMSNLIALFAGGYVAGRAGNSFFSKAGVMQGFLTWALYCVLSVLIVSSAVGTLISGVGTIVGKALSATGEAVVEQVAPEIGNRLQNLDYNLIEAREEIYQLLRDADKEALDPETLEKKAEKVVSEAESQADDAVMNPRQAEKEVAEVFEKAKDKFEPAFEEVDKEALVNILVKRTAMSKSEAERTVDNYLEAYEDLREETEALLEKSKEKARENAEEAAEAVAEAAVFLAIALILGVVVAMLGGLAGVKNLRHDYEQRQEDVY